jgi:hypothetical protein
MDSKFATLELQNSITYEANNPLAIDKANPLPFLDWVKYFASISTDPSFLLIQYKNYVNAWFNVQKTNPTDKQNTVKNLYVSLFKDISVNFLTHEEKRFVSNVNLNNVSEITAILPLFVRKIKDICLYFVSQRENVKHSVYDHNLKSSPFSIDKAINNALNQSFLDPKINKLFADSGISINDVRNKLIIEIEPLYDLETNYYDINPNLSLSAYDATNLRLQYGAANAYDFDPNLFVDFDNSVINAISQYPVILQELGANFSVNLNFTGQDLQYLKDEDFTSLVNDLDTNNLRLQSLKEGLQYFSGSNFYYLSTNATKQFAYGKLFETNTFANYLNRRFPTVAMVESDKLVPENTVGRFYKPDKLGILNFLNFTLEGKVNSLSANYIYVFPDPSIYGNISGLSRTKLDTPFIYSEDASVLKNNNINNFAFGKALTDYLTKFRGYQSRSESLNYDATGISRTQDPIDFFKGDRDLNWANSDVYPVSSITLPIQSRHQVLLSNLYNKTLYQHKADIFNNEFGLYKEIYATPNPASIKATEIGITQNCLTLDGYSFFDSISGYNFDFTYVNSSLNYSGVTTNTNGLTALSSYDYYIQCILLYPEDFYKTTVSFNVSLQDSFGFLLPDNYNLQTFECSGFKDGIFTHSIYSILTAASALESGPLQFNSADATPIIIDQSHIEHNLILGQTLSSASTTTVNISGNLTSDLSLYRQRLAYGDLYWRNSNSTIITPASSALSGLFVKYNANINYQLFSKLREFDLVIDTAIFETDNYLVFERLSFNYDTGSYIPQPSFQNYIEKATTTYTNDYTNNLYNNLALYNHFTNTWYDESNEIILVGRTRLISALSATNNRSIAIDLFKYDFQTVKQVGNTALYTFTLSSTSLSSVNIVNIERPILNYNSDTGNYIIKFLTKDSSEIFFDTTVYFKLDQYNNVYNLNAYTLYPNMYIFSENFGSLTFSSILQATYSVGNAPNMILNGNSLSITNNP